MFSLNQLMPLLCLWLITQSSQAVTVPQYTINTRFVVATQSIHVSLTLSLDNRVGQQDTLQFLLNKNAQIQTIIGGGQPLRFQFDSSGHSPNRYQPDARRLFIPAASLPMGITTLAINYDCFLGDMQKAGCAYTPEYIELNNYENWFPYNDAYGRFTFRVNVLLDPGYQFTGAGRVSGSAGNWQLTQQKPVNDIVLVASPRLKTKFYSRLGSTIRVDYFGLPEVKADSILNNCRSVLACYTALFGPIEKSSLTLFINPSRDRTSYARREFISFQINGQSINQTIQGIGHEIGHFWWNRANTDTWEDWLNESFAEYSALLYLRQGRGTAAFAQEIDRYRKTAQSLPPLRGMNRSFEQASTVLYRKGPVILYELEKQVGPTPFAALLRETVRRNVSRTDEFLKLITQRFPPAVARAVDAALNQ